MNSQSQAAINSLNAKVARLEADNSRLKAENSRLSGNSGDSGQMRQCPDCGQYLPDGLDNFPGFLEPEGSDSAAEWQRYRCFYCR